MDKYDLEITIQNGCLENINIFDNDCDHKSEQVDFNVVIFENQEDFDEYWPKSQTNYIEISALITDGVFQDFNAFIESVSEELGNKLPNYRASKRKAYC